MNEDVEGILSETIKIRMDMDRRVVMPSVIFSSLGSFIEDVLEVDVSRMSGVLSSPEESND